MFFAVFYNCLLLLYKKFLSLLARILNINTVTDQNLYQFRSLNKISFLSFSDVRASFQTGVDNMIKLDMHRSRITAFREAKFFISKSAIKSA